MAAEPGDATTLDSGHGALRRGAWEEAREAFAAALELEETPEALEGLSWATWWLDDAEAVFDARERAFHLYRAAGDDVGAARMATWLAVDQLDFNGAAAVAAGWLGRARRLLEPVPACPEHGWLAFHEGYIVNAEGDTERGLELAAEATRIGLRFGVADLEMLGLALQGGALVAEARVEEGMRCLDEATATALEGEATIPISGAWACCFLVSACASTHDYARAAEWCDRIAEFAERYGSRYMLAFCRAEYGNVELWRGEWRAAERMLEDSIADFASSRPAWVGSPMLGLAELRRRQGRAEDALRLLDGAEPSPAAQLCRARMALDRGDGREAVELVERALRQLPADRRLERAPALALAVRARASAGALGPAAEALSELRAVDSDVDTQSLRAAVDAAEASLRAAAGEHDAARTLLEDAVDAFERGGAPYEAAVARLDLAASLASLGRSEQAAREAGTAGERLRALGAAVDLERAEALLAGLEGADQPLPELTAREREILTLLAEGLTNRRIAERLVISEHTVHRHVTNILRKLELPSRTAAAALAARAGLVADPGE